MVQRAWLPPWRHPLLGLGIAVALGTTGAMSRAPAQERPLTIDASRLARIDGVVEQAVARGELPGAVVLVVHGGQTVFHKGYGLRSREPMAVPMTPETLFDLASLTKPLATATSILLLL